MSSEGSGFFFCVDALFEVAGALFGVFAVVVGLAGVEWRRAAVAIGVLEGSSSSSLAGGVMIPLLSGWKSVC